MADHECPKIACKKRIPRNKLACYEHWMLVPGALRAKINRLWRGGDFGEYLEAREEAIDAMNTNRATGEVVRG